ncbi:MAG: hypothetical protein OER83_03340 [Flavobacteriaceae bacterium]|nr:hypothetical protein [Flavobacteriaceae bacterium]
MKRIYLLALLSLGLLISCEEDLIIYDSENGQTYVQFGSNTINLPVVFDSSADIEIPVEVSTLSSSDRSVTVNVVSTGAEDEASPNQYNVGGTVTIPANEYTGMLSFTGIDDGIEIGETKVVTLEVTGISSDSDANIDSRTLVINMFQVCPVEADFFIGDYSLVTTANGIFGTTIFPQGIVTIQQGASSNDARFFNAAIYPDLGAFGSIDFNFILVCGTVVVPSGQVTGVGCTASTTLGPASASGGYTAGDDSVLVIDFVDDEAANCGAAVNVSITLTRV